MSNNRYWIDIQKKAFTRFTNSHLKNRNIVITEITQDFRTGVNLAHLVELLSSHTIPFNRNPRMEVQMMENLTQVLEHCKRDCGMKLVNIGPEDFYRGTENIILGFIWQLILKYKVNSNNNNDSNAAQELLQWVQRTIPQYGIQNFTTDWQSGKALCALIGAVQPGLLTLPQAFANDPTQDMALALRSSRQIGIEPLLDAEDIINGPDQHSMMTYLAYFRDYDANRHSHDTIERESIPDRNRCIVYGPALNPGNEVGQETYFTIEVRNAFDRKIVNSRGRYKLNVKITGSHSQTDFEAKENDDGTFFVTFVPKEDGNHVIEVKLDGLPIGNSPVHVSFKSAMREKMTKPVPHWFVQDLVTKKFVPYPPQDNEVIEQHFSQYGGGIINLREFRIDTTKYEEVNTAQKHIFNFITRPIMRGTWFWQDDEQWYPYDTATATILEKAFQENRFTENVPISDGKKVRYVSQFPDGCFKQFRQARDAQPGGRPVQRGYNGKVIEYEQPQ